QYPLSRDFPSILAEPTIALARGDVNTTFSLKRPSTASTSLLFQSEIQRSAKAWASILALTSLSYQNLVTSVKLNSFTFIAGTTMSNDSSPHDRTGTLIASTFESIWIKLSLNRKFRTPPC